MTYSKLNYFVVVFLTSAMHIFMANSSVFNLYSGLRAYLILPFDRHLPEMQCLRTTSLYMNIMRQ